MPITLLAAVQAACGESGIEVPNVVVANTDQSFRHIANGSIRRLRQYGWQQLILEYPFTLMDGVYTYNLPTDFYAYIPDTMWIEGSGIKPIMPTPLPIWQQIVVGGIINVGQYQFIFLRDVLRITNPVDGVNVSYRYVSTNVVRDAGSAYQSSFSADTDACQLDEELFVLDLKWRIKKEKGIEDWPADKQEFEQYLRYRLGVDKGAMTLSPNQSVVTPQPPYTNLWVP